ncbi:TPA: hypothetical protein QCW55_005633 [Bacillus cereus]|nr:hypothetical protein [Bacillus cereus]
MGDVIRFPKPIVELTEEEYEKFIEYKEKMSAAETLAEMRFYHSKAKHIIERANERKNK